MVDRPKWNEWTILCSYQMSGSPRRLSYAQYDVNCKNWPNLTFKRPATAIFFRISRNWYDIWNQCVKLHQVRCGERVLETKNEKGVTLVQVHDAPCIVPIHPRKFGNWFLRPCLMFSWELLGQQWLWEISFIFFSLWRQWHWGLMTPCWSQWFPPLGSAFSGLIFAWGATPISCYFLNKCYWFWCYFMCWCHVYFGCN